MSLDRAELEQIHEEGRKEILALAREFAYAVREAETARKNVQVARRGPYRLDHDLLDLLLNTEAELRSLAMNLQEMLVASAIIYGVDSLDE
jgi:hypothetical protein